MGKLALAAIVSSWVVPITILFNRIAPEPYMDEIFHVPQAQQYCKGNFWSWDPMITTPPGLIILYDIITHLKPTLDDRKKMLHAVVLSLYPLHWFFTFLYYTDVASLTAVLAMYLASLKKNYWFSALIGAFSVVIRQTNIIWVLFVACTGILDISLNHNEDNVRTAKSDLSIINPSLAYATGTSAMGLNMRKRKSVKYVDTFESSLPSTPAPSPLSSSGLVDEIQAILLTLWHKKLKILISFSPYLLVFVAFLLFVRWNGSVVLGTILSLIIPCDLLGHYTLFLTYSNETAGAKEAHTVSPHFAQILYFSLVSVLALAPMFFTVTQALDIFHLLWECRPFYFFQGFLALTAGFLSVHFFSVAHPYLLADNRHYPFYLWRKVIMVHWSIKYLLVPIYICSWLSIIHMLGKFRNKIWVLAYFLATAAVLVPAPLIEFRYYTIPFYLLVLHCNIKDSKKWLLTGMLYIGVNIFTVMMFLFRPFHWDHEPGIQRFIW